MGTMEFWWYALTKGFTLKHYDEPKKNSRYSHWVKKIDTGKTNKTSWGNEWEIYEYEFYDNNLNPIKFEFDGWRILRAYDPLGKNAFTFKVKMDIADPLGEVQTVYTESNDIFGIEDGLKKLQSICEFDSWKMFEIDKENTELKEEVESLSSKIEEYEGMIDSMKSTEFFESLMNELTPIEGDIEQIDEFLETKGLSKDFYEKWCKE